MDTAEMILELVQTTLQEFDRPDSRLSSVIRKAIRIARLRNDYENLWWLELEMCSHEDGEHRSRLRAEISPHYAKGEFEAMAAAVGNAFISERQLSTADGHGNVRDQGQIWGGSIPELEVQIENVRGQLNRLKAPPGLAPRDLYQVLHTYDTTNVTLTLMVQQYQIVLDRVRQRVHNFLSNNEKHLLYGQINADIFDRNRQYVDQYLAQIAPDILAQLVSVYKRANEGDIEARS